MQADRRRSRQHSGAHGRIRHSPAAARRVVIGRTEIVAASGVWSRLLPARVSDIHWIHWARLDIVAGVLFLVAAGCCLFRVLKGDVTIHTCPVGRRDAAGWV